MGSSMGVNSLLSNQLNPSLNRIELLKFPALALGKEQLITVKPSCRTISSPQIPQGQTRRICRIIMYYDRLTNANANNSGQL